LTELNVAFPITHNFGRFFPDRTTALHIPIDEVLEGLQHLGLYVCAQITTNKNVQGYVIPAEYADHPKSATWFHLHRMIALPTGLKSLEISSEEPFDFDFSGLFFPTSLRSLYLKGIITTSDTITSFIRRSSESLRYIELLEVELMLGKWQDVLLETGNLKHLLNFGIRSSGYSSTLSTPIITLGFRSSIRDSGNTRELNSRDIYAISEL
jgi:hypothetical protein